MKTRSIIRLRLFSKHLLLFALLNIYLIFNSVGQVVVDFEANIKTGCSPLQLNFINKSTPLAGATFKWIFGNGNGSDLFEPFAIYGIPGTYDVSLILFHDGKSDTIKKEKFVQVFADPIADFIFTGNRWGCAPFATTFENKSTIADAPIVQMKWDYGDGVIEENLNPQHLYQFPGVFNVSLLVMDQNGCKANKIIENLVEVFKPTVSFSANQTSSCSGSLVAKFKNSSIGQSAMSYEWKFGDGGFSTHTEPVHEYSVLGNFSTTLTAIDIHNCKDSLRKANYISVIKVKALFSVLQDTACANEAIAFTNNSEYNSDYQWDFGDKTISGQKNPLHIYKTYGDYFVKLKVSQKGACADSITKRINIEQIKADFGVAQNYACSVPFGANYANNSINSIKWLWKFGNGNISTEKYPSDTTFFLKNNMKTAYFKDTLIAYSPHGCKDIKIKDSSIIIILPQILFSPSLPNAPELSGCVPLSVSFKNQSNYASKFDAIRSYEWNFGDTKTSANPSENHIFTTVGIFKVSLSIETQMGCKAKKEIIVQTGNRQTPDFSLISNKNACASDTIFFVNKSSDQNLITSYSWNFGDESTSTLISPKHLFQNTGYLNVTLTVNYNGCSNTLKKDSLVFIKSPIASFTSNFDCKSPLVQNFTGKIVGAETYSWDFGDQKPPAANIPTPTHNYDAAGDYNITLLATNSATGCTFQARKTIQVRKIEANFNLAKATLCSGETLTLDGSVSTDENFFSSNGLLYKYLWILGDARNQILATNPIINKFDKKGTFQVGLVVKDINLCSDTLFKTIKIFQPTVDFVANYTEGCLPAKFTFTNLTSSDTTINNWKWNFGDLKESIEKNTSHSYFEFGNYPVSLTATDENGCTNSIIKANIIKVTKPDVRFLASSYKACFGDSIQFHDISESKIVAYDWDFGDGTTSKEIAPYHTYPDSGFYTVRLNIIDDHSCDSASKLNNFIHIQKPPKVDFIAYPLAFNCYPSQVSFKDQSISKYLFAWKWKFGDNLTASELQNSAHTYFKPGNYDVTLYSYSSYGCVDSLTKASYIKISGPWAKISAPDTICKDAPTELSIDGKLNLIGFKWDLGNGNFSFQDRIQTIYKDFGNVYPSILLFSDNNHTCDKLITDSIHVFKILANYSTDIALTGCIPLKLNILNQSTNAQKYSWLIDGKLMNTSKDWANNFDKVGDYQLKLKVMGKFNCADSIEKKATVFPLPRVSISSDTLICRNQNVNLFASGGIKYRWLPTKWLNNPSIATPLAKPDSTVRYNLTVTDINNCVSLASLKIRVQQIPYVPLKDTALIIGEKFQINTAQGDISKFAWSPDFGISCLTCPNPIFNPLETTRYTLTVTDTSNCFNVDYTKLVEILKKYTVDVPTVFTPNNDGFNDVIYVRGWGIQDLLEFRIFNRFGEMVFESTELLMGWDGTYKGNAQNAETFSYTVKVKTFEGDILTKKGFIKLIR